MGGSKKYAAREHDIKSSKAVSSANFFSEETGDDGYSGRVYADSYNAKPMRDDQRYGRASESPRTSLDDMIKDAVSDTSNQIRNIASKYGVI